MASSADPLTPPRAWRNATFREFWLRVVALAGAATVLAAPVIFVRALPALGVLAFGLGLVGVAHLVTYGRRIGRGESPRLADGGFELPFSRIRQQAEWVAHAGYLLVMVAAVVAGDTEGRVIGALVTALLVLWLPRPRRLVLTPKGLTYTEGRTTYEAEWPDVTELEADRDWVIYYGAVEWHLLVYTKHRGVVRTKARGVGTKRSELVMVDVDYLALDPSLAYWVISYYVAHTDAREELADDRSLDRVARGALT